MNKIMAILFLFIFMNSQIVAEDANLNKQKNIKVLFTAAIISGDSEYVAKRKSDYIENLEKLRSYGCEVYVVESCSQGTTYLDDYCDHVCYTNSNDPNRSKSNNEIVSMRIGLDYFNFNPDDIIIKITGRYVLQTDEFIRLVEKNRDADVIARIWDPEDAYTGLLAVKTGVFLDFIDNYYLSQVDDPKYSQPIVPNYGNLAFEHAFARYIHLNLANLKIVLWPRLYDWIPRCVHEDG